MYWFIGSSGLSRLANAVASNLLGQKVLKKHYQKHALKY